jgi:protein translocase SecG subunit
MSMQVTILLVIQVIASFSIIALVLLQQGKGADMGSAFGGGASGSLFGATGAANFLSRATKWAAVVFFIATIGLAYLSTLGLKTQNDGLMESFTNGNAVHLQCLQEALCHLLVGQVRRLPCLLCRQHQLCQQCLNKCQARAKIIGLVVSCGYTSDSI